jgi:hypothetical protein
MGSLFAKALRLFDLLLRRPSLVRQVRRRDRVSYPPSSPVRRYRKGVLFVRLEPETQRGLQRGLDRVFPPGTGDADE